MTGEFYCTDTKCIKSNVCFHDMRENGNLNWIHPDLPKLQSCLKLVKVDSKYWLTLGAFKTLITQQTWFLKSEAA